MTMEIVDDIDTDMKAKAIIMFTGDGRTVVDHVSLIRANGIQVEPFAGRMYANHVRNMYKLFLGLGVYDHLPENQTE